MPIKRRATSTETAPRRRAARRAISDGASEPRILSSEEKRELILAHAEARHPIDPMQRMTVAVGVAVCVLVIAGAWLYTVGSGIQKTFAGPLDPDLKNAVDSVKKIGSESGDDVAAVSEQAQVVIDQWKPYAEQQAVVDLLTEQLTATSTSSSRPDLFQPPTTTTHPLK